MSSPSSAGLFGTFPFLQEDFHKTGFRCLLCLLACPAHLRLNPFEGGDNVGARLAGGMTFLTLSLSLSLFL